MRYSPEEFGGKATRRGLFLAIIVGLSLVFSYLVLKAPEAKAQYGIDYIQIRSAPGGGGEIIGNRTYYVGDTDHFYAAGYNFTYDFVQDVETWWYSQSPNVGDVSPYRGVTTTFTATSAGQTYVQASYNDSSPGNGTRTLDNDTGTLTVQWRNIDYVEIRDAPHGGGAIVKDREYFVGDTAMYYAAAYNHASGYMGEVETNWTSNNTGVCNVVRERLAATFRALNMGVCHVTAEYNATLSNVTGNLTVKHRPVLTVDDSGGADYYTIHEAIENASDGYMIYIFNGTYAERLIVDKSLYLRGESMGSTFVDGDGTGIVFKITAADVNITRFTIRNATYGIYLDHSNNSKITYSTIESYEYGIYANRSQNAFIAWNTITEGKYGIVTDHVTNDAVRYNEISHNSEYGAKDFDSSLKNCFNWNYFHNNHIAYYYDPDEQLPPLTFDGNRIELNDIGIKASSASSLIATNNTIVRNGVGIDLDDSSPSISSNIITDNEIGIRFKDSAAQVFRNTIAGGKYGIMGSGVSPTFEDNLVTGTSVLAMDIKSATALRLTNNDIELGTIEIVDSSVKELNLKRSNVQLVNSTVLATNLDASSRIYMQWYLTVVVTDEAGQPVANASVRVFDDTGAKVAEFTTAIDGSGGPAVLTGATGTQTIGPNGSTVMYTYEGPYVVEVTQEGRTQSDSVHMTFNKQLAISFAPIPVPGGWLTWLFFGVVGSAAVFTFAGLMSMEIFLYFIVALFIPLYTKLRKEQVLDHYNRGRVYQFIELNPGEHFNAIRHSLDMNIGTATYHLEVLSRAGLIKARQDGIYKRFYPANVPIPPSNGNGVSEVQLRVFNLIKEAPGITQKELARLLGVRQSTLNYQVSRLEEKGFVTEERKGRKVHYFPKQPLPPPQQ